MTTDACIRKFPYLLTYCVVFRTMTDAAGLSLGGRPVRQRRQENSADAIFLRADRVSPPPHASRKGGIAWRVPLMIMTG